MDGSVPVKGGISIFDNSFSILIFFTQIDVIFVDTKSILQMNF